MSASASPCTEAIAELRKHPRWVVWREERRDDRLTKVPYNPSEPRVRASSTDPQTWTAYGHAAAAVQRAQAAGVGYVFSPDDEYVGVDLDKCVVDGHVDPRAMDVVRALDSYTELSPSGTGLHIISRGRINGDRKRTSKTPWGGEFESYDQGRFFTVTERHLDGTPTRIEARQEELDAVRAQMFPEPQKSSSNGTATGIDDDAEILRRARGAKNGREFDALYNGDTGRHSDDDSAADLALCNMLSFWAGPHPERIDSLFRRSGLMRDKWDSPRPGGTYGSETIAKALADRSEFYSARNQTPPRARAQDGRESAVQDARDELAAMLGLDALALRITSAVASAHDSKAAVEIHTSDGGVLRLDPLSAYTSAAKLTAEVAFQLGAEPTITGPNVKRILSLLRTVCEYRESITLDERALDFGISFLQEAKTRSVDMGDQRDRWNAFFDLSKINPIASAKTEDTSIAAQSVILEDSTSGIRYPRIQWFSAYVKAQAAPGVADDVSRRMRALGWDKPGAEGRIKATAPGGGLHLQWMFYAVPAGWEER